MKLGLTLVGFSTLAVLPASAGDLYKWVDEAGRTQLSDIVPEKYKKSATRIDGKKYELTAEQRAESDARSERERAADAARRKVSAQVAASAAIAASSSTPSKPKAEPEAKTDCETLQRL